MRDLAGREGHPHPNLPPSRGKGLLFASVNSSRGKGFLFARVNPSRGKGLLFDTVNLSRAGRGRHLALTLTLSQRERGFCGFVVIRGRAWS